MTEHQKGFTHLFTLQNRQQCSRTSSRSTLTRRTCTTLYTIRGHGIRLYRTAVYEERPVS